MQQTFKAKVTNLFQEKLEVQDASDESSDMTAKEHSEELFVFLLKTSINTCRDRATKVFKSFVDEKPQIQIGLSTVKLSE